MDWSVLAFPLARLSCNTTPKSRQLTFRNAAEEGAAHGNKSRQRGQAGRPEKPLQRRGGTRTRLHAPVSSIQQRRRETSSFDAVPTQPWRLGGLLVFVRPLEEKKSLGSKKGVSTPALHASSNAENKHGNRHPPLFPARSPLTPRLGRCPSPINKGFFFLNAVSSLQTARTCQGVWRQGRACQLLLTCSNVRHVFAINNNPMNSLFSFAQMLQTGQGARQGRRLAQAWAEAKARHGRTAAAW